MAEYPPYVNAFNSIPKLFAGIRTAAVPPKVHQNFLESVLELKSSSHRALIPLLKKLGFIDAANVPTQAYKDFRADDVPGAVMAERLRDAYKSLFAANEYAWKLSKQDLMNKLLHLTGAGEDDAYIPAIASTFIELAKMAKWDADTTPLTKKEPESAVKSGGNLQQPRTEEDPPAGLRLSYTINLNLPATTEIEVFNAIFKSLRENLLRQ